MKHSLVRPEHKQKVLKCYGALVNHLKGEVARIKKHGPALVLEIDFDLVRQNGQFDFDYKPCLSKNVRLTVPI